MNRLRFAIGGMLLGLASCVPIPAIQPDSKPLIGTLKSRHHTIHVYAGAELRYTVEDAAGETLVEIASPDDFLKVFHELYVDLQRILAANTLWADRIIVFPGCARDSASRSLNSSWALTEGGDMYIPDLPARKVERVTGPGGR